MSKKIAIILRKAADAYAARHKINGSRYSTHRAVIMKDWADLTIIANYIESGNRPLALDTAQKLDTAVRDEIPESVWHWLELSDINEAAKCR